MRVMSCVTDVGVPRMEVAWATEVMVVTGPPSSLLVRELMKPCFVEVMVKVVPGCVIVIGRVVLTTPVEVMVDSGAVITLTTETTPVDMLTTVAAGAVVVMVVSWGAFTKDETKLTTVVRMLPPDVMV